MQGGAREVFPTGNNKSQSCKMDHTKIFVLVCAWLILKKKLNIPLKTILELSYFQCFLRQRLPFLVKIPELPYCQSDFLFQLFYASKICVLSPPPPLLGYSIPDIVLLCITSVDVHYTKGN